jgi:DNA-binding MarR family transcriptional regulator
VRDGEIDPAANPRAAMIAVARELYRERRRRDALFGDAELFGEPAWDILLDLYVATHDGRTIPVTSACIAASVPVTTALRWLGHLQSRDLIRRGPDPQDRRRTLVRLTDKGSALMEDYLGAAARGPVR